MKSLAAKIAISVLAVALLIYAGFQIYSGFFKPYDTETVNERTYEQTIDLNGFIVRDEVLLPSLDKGVASYNYKNSEKISKDAVIANIYSQKNDLYNNEKIETLKTKIEILKKAMVKSDITGIKPDMLNSQISDSIMSIVQNVDEGSISKIDSISKDMLLNMDKLSIYLDNNTDYGSVISKLEAELKSLESSNITPIKTVKSETAGYFCVSTDGYENLFKVSDLDNLSVNDIRNLQKKSPEKLDAIGKVQSGSRWYFVSEISLENAKYFKLGSSVKLKFSSTSQNKIDADVYKIITENKSAAVIFSCGYIDENIISKRFEKPQVILSSSYGIVIPAKALRVKQIKDQKNGTDTTVYGVYVLVNNSSRFKRLDIIYQDDYVVISKPSQSSEFVNSFDDVIVKGNDLNESSS